MGKTARWFRGLLGGKNEYTSSSSAVAGGTDAKPAKKKWSFMKSFRDKEVTAAAAVNSNERKGSYRESNHCSSSTYSYLDDVDQNKHAIAIAAATAAVAEKAVAAAHAAAAVVKLTSSGRCTTTTTTAYFSYSSSSGLRREDWAALKIQSAFRGYLARRALQALKGLVKLQALVRGHIVRKKTAEALRCMQALVRVQVQARSSSSHISEFRHHTNLKSSLSHQPEPATPEKYEHGIRSKSTRHDRPSSLKRNGSSPNNRDIGDQDRVQMGWNWLDHIMDENSWNQCRETLMKTGPQDDEKSDKILEIDPGKPSKFKNSFSLAQQTSNPDQYNHSFTTMDSPSKDSTTAQLSAPSTSSGEVQSVNCRRFPHQVEDSVFCTAENSPQLYSASSRLGSERRGPFTPAKSECSKSFLSGYSDYPNYMANTESSRAKVRSQSAPKQRLEFEKSSSTKRYSVHGFSEVRSSSTSRGSALHANFTSKVYPGSGRLDRLGMPVCSSGETVGFTGVNRNIY